MIKARVWKGFGTVFENSYHVTHQFLGLLQLGLYPFKLREEDG